MPVLLLGEAMGGALAFLQELARTFLGPALKSPPAYTPPTSFVSHDNVESISAAVKQLNDPPRK